MTIILCLFLFYAKFVYSPVIYAVSERYKNFNTTDVPEGLDSLSAKECGGCHVKIYDEWKGSMHAKAFVDPYYQAYLKKDRNHWTCYYCHTQLERQLEFKVIGFVNDDMKRPILEQNPDFDASLRDEGVTCAGCHVINGVIYGPYDDVDAPHKTKYSPKFQTTEICEECHTVDKDTFMFYKGNPCGTVEEFFNSPYKAKGYRCQTCHMPTVLRPLTYDSKEFREVGRHTFMGGQSEEMLEKALYINLEKQEKKFSLSVMNNGAGHKFPTGDPDRYVNIITKFFDISNELITEEVETFKRVILYFPIIIEFSDNRLGPLKERIYEYDDKKALKRAKYATVEVEYNILSESRKAKLVKKYGLPEETVRVIKLAPIRFNF
jgi:hypothetical protein